jgi:hypothetical protein
MPLFFSILSSVDTTRLFHPWCFSVRLTTGMTHPMGVLLEITAGGFMPLVSMSSLVVCVRS